jgi:GNAT superfamily N-acetyltransferase
MISEHKINNMNPTNSSLISRLPENYAIIDAQSDQEIMVAFEVMKQLRTHLQKEDFITRIRRQQLVGYKIVYLTVNGSVVCVAGIRLTENLAMGRHIYVDDLVTDEAHRSRGYGAILLQWTENFCRQEGCTEVHLDSGVQRFEAHRFYFAQRMSIVFYHFSKKI